VSALQREREGRKKEREMLFEKVAEGLPSSTEK